ncbi:MAG: 1,4-dihydroxy-6-naphthoate synthase [Sphingobacteriales bacterium]|nr:MAG: 1,4-dihydroxy-6-naphthoate synthase [Sphingobacteriales bacterium]TAF82814.1 MAG: 1,4-dihydroxy-6-naphthoate synthase [Sphingobacteriales bacterium]
MKLSLGFSPCPNDTFIFDALIHHKIDTEGLQFDVHFEDVETLNNKAFAAELDITKLSYFAFAHVLKHYVLLHSGSALGYGVGPLLISKQKNLSILDKNLKVGIPGKFTTANFLLHLAYPQLSNKVSLLFSDIEQKLLDEEIDLGLIIHENRFTYQHKGLHLVQDLGTFWEQQTACPIPLGGIVIKRTLPNVTKQKVQRVLQKSVEYALNNPASSLNFIRLHAQEMSEEVMYKHINLYVNNYSVNLGVDGRKAIEVFFKKAKVVGLINEVGEDVFF